MARAVGHELSGILGAELNIGRVQFGLPNRLIAEDIFLKDLSGAEVARVSKLSAKVDILSLFSGRISVGTAQLFGFRLRVERETPESLHNLQFVIDALSPSDSKQKDTSLDVRINSLLIRRGEVSYDVLSEPLTPDTFNISHLHLRNLAANISLKALRNDSLNASIRQMSFEEEHSGFKLNKLNFRMVGNARQAMVETFHIELPDTRIVMDSIRLNYDLSTLQHVADDVNFHFQLASPQVTLKDFSAFLPFFKSFTEPLSMRIEAEGTLNDLTCPVISVNVNEHILTDGNVVFSHLFIPDSAYVSGRMSRIWVDQSGIPMVLRNLNAGSDNGSEFFQRLGTLNFSGNIDGYLNSFVAKGLLQTGLGNLQADMQLASARAESPFRYSGSLQTSGFQLGRLLSQEKLGSVSMQMNVSGSNPSSGFPNATFSTVVDSLEYNDYVYRNILLDAEYKNGGFNGDIRLDDENIQFQANGNFNLQSALPVYDFTASLQHFRPDLTHFTDSLRRTEASGTLRANFRGHNIDDMIGHIDFDSIAFITGDQAHFLRNLHISADKDTQGNKQIEVSSEFINGQIRGAFSYATLPASILKILEEYIPSLVQAGERKKEESNVFEFSFRIDDTDMFAAVTQIPFRVYSPSVLSGFVNERLQKIRVEGYFPRLSYDNRFIESATLLCDNPDDRLRFNLRFNNLNRSNSMNVTINADVANDSLRTAVNWGNNASSTFSGRLSALALFDRVQQERSTTLRTIVSVEPSDLVISDTLWNIHPSNVVIDGGKIQIDNFHVTGSDDRYLSINGILSEAETDSVFLDLKDIDIQYVFDVADLGVNISGYATGPVVASSVMKEPKMNADLFIHSIGFEGGYLGDAYARLEWDHPVKGLHMVTDIIEGDTARTHVAGYIYPLKPTSSLDLQINAHGTNLQFMESILADLTPEFSGRASGDVRVYGKFKELNLEGAATVDATMKIDFLNIALNVKDEVKLHPGGLIFTNNRVYDTEGHEGHASGTVNYQHFKNISYNFDIALSNMLILHTESAVDFPFYGTVYGTGTVNIFGNPQSGMNMDVALTTDRNSVFTYIKDYVSTATEDAFIKYVDKTPRRNALTPIELSEFDLAQMAEQKEEEEGDFSDIRLNLAVDITRDFNLRIVMDPFSGDNISCYGTGNLTAEYFNKGDFRLFGAYNINQGVYKMSIQQIMKKDFTILDGSSITFDGEPLDGVLDLQTRYQVNSASLNDLIPNAGAYVDQTLVRVNCLLNMSGRLTSPSVSMGLELPLERDEVQALVHNYIATDEQMNTQILYLLTIGKFYTPDNGSGTQSNMMSSVISSTLSGQLNSMLSNVINNNNWNFGTNLSTGEEGWNDMEVEGILSGQLLNNRLLINGNFGYRENRLMNTNTNFVGDIDAEWLVNSSGNIRLRAYNETNDRSYIRTNLTTQGIGIVFKKDFERWRELLFWNRWKLNRLKKRAASSAPPGDNDKDN